MTAWPEPLLVEGPAGASSLALYEMAGEGPPLLLVHATGFCGRVFEPFARAAGGFRPVAMDLRGHGLSRARAGEIFAWDGFAQDVLAAAAYLARDGEEVFAFGHSCGGAALLAAEMRAPGSFAAIYCYEPTVVLSDGIETHAEQLAAIAARRTLSFASEQAAVANFSQKPPMSCFHPDAIAGYVRGGFEAGPQGVTLRCRPEDEALVYKAVPAASHWAGLGEISAPVVLGCGVDSDTFTPAVTSAIAQVIGCPSEAYPALGHFGPMQDPFRVAARAASRLASARAGATDPVPPGQGARA